MIFILNLCRFYFRPSHAMVVDPQLYFLGAEIARPLLSWLDNRIVKVIGAYSPDPSRIDRMFVSQT